MLSLTVNGKKMELTHSVSLFDYLNAAGIQPQAVVVELNHGIPERAKWSEIMLNNGDNLEIVKFIGGG